MSWITEFKAVKKRADASVDEALHQLRLNRPKKEKEKKDQGWIRRFYSFAKGDSSKISIADYIMVMKRLDEKAQEMLLIERVANGTERDIFDKKIEKLYAGCNSKNPLTRIISEIKLELLFDKMNIKR